MSAVCLLIAVVCLVKQDCLGMLIFLVLSGASGIYEVEHNISNTH